MRIKRKARTNVRSNDQDLPKDVEGRTETTHLTDEKREVENSHQSELNDIKPGSKSKDKKPKKIGREIGQKISRNATENGTSSQSNVLTMKELQIKLKRCDALPEDEDFELCSGSDVSDNSKQLDDIKPKSNTRGKKVKKSSREKKKANNVPETTGNELVQESIETLESGDDSELSVDADKKVKSVPNQIGKGSKRKRGSEKQSEKNGDDDVKPTKSAKKEKDSDKSKSSRDKIPDVTAIDFSNDSVSPSGNKWNFKISSWNINGIRAWLEKNGLSYLHHEKPDIICIQETKCSDDKLPEEMKKIEGYHAYWLSGDKDGYSGVGLLSKQEPIKVEYGIGISEHDNEGRVITAEYEKFYLVAAYVPNAGRKLVRLDYRTKWDVDFRAYLKKLDAEKPVILCGDLNVAHEEIDLANPKTNKKNAGFTKEEREGFSTLLEQGFTDTFRHLYPDVKGAFTFWTYMINARAKNVGWRLDYFVISERFCENLCDSVIRKDVCGSDHCPITLFLSL